MNLRSNLARMASLLVLFGLAARGHALIVQPIWPASDEDWVPIMEGGGVYVDPLWEGLGTDYYATPPQPEQVDLVGGIDHHGEGPFATGFWATDAHNLMFRMRVDNDPSQGVFGSQYVWSVFLNTDIDDAIDFVLQLDNKTDTQVELVPALQGGPGGANPWDPVVLAATPHAGVPLNDFSRFVPVSSTLNVPWTGSHFHSDNVADTDFFVDIAFPKELFTSMVGASVNEVQAVIATSADHININKDLPGGGWSDSFVIPEPSTIGLALLGALAGLVFRFRRAA